MKLWLLLLIPLSSWATPAIENRLATGQGIAAPNVTSLVNWSRGFTVENPAGVMYQDGFRVSVQAARKVDTDIGYEGGYSGKTYGLAVGMLNNGCSGCKPTTAVDLGANLGKNFAIGGRYQTQNNTPTYGFGLLVNPSGPHRLGVNVDYMMPSIPKTSTTSFGGGYAYVDKNKTIALEVSKRSYESAAVTTGNIMIASASFVKRVDPMSVSITYETRMQDTVKPNDLLWMGAGFDSEKWNLAVYVNYQQEMMFVLTGFL